MEKSITRAEAAAQLRTSQSSLLAYTNKTATLYPFKGIGRRKTDLFLSMLSHVTSHPLAREPHASSAGRCRRCAACPDPAAAASPLRKRAGWNVPQDRQSDTSVTQDPRLERGAVEVQKCLQELLTMHRVLISVMLLLPSGRAKPQ